MKTLFQRWFPPLLMASMALWFLCQIQTPPDHGFAFNEFGQLPVVFNGRLKPIDSLARNSLLQIREKQTLDLEPWKKWYQSQEIIPANQWLANLIMNPQVADSWPVFRLDNPDLITFLKLPGRDPDQHQDGKHYSWNQIKPSLAAFDGENERIETNVPSASRNAYEHAVIKVHERLELLCPTQKFPATTGCHWLESAVKRLSQFDPRRSRCGAGPAVRPEIRRKCLQPVHF